MWHEKPLGEVEQMLENNFEPSKRFDVAKSKNFRAQYIRVDDWIVQQIMKTRTVCCMLKGCGCWQKCKKSYK